MSDDFRLPGLSRHSSTARGSAYLAVLLSAGLSACTVQEAEPNLQGQDIHLTVLHTADVHSRIIPYQYTPNHFDLEYGDLPAYAPFGGAARMNTLLMRERARSVRSLHLNSGDAWEGAPIFNLFKGAPEFIAHTALGVDAAALGNHEFDLGPNILATQISTWAGFPILAANYVFSDFNSAGANSLGQVIHPYTILDVQGLKVGVIGFGNVESLGSIVQGGNKLGITALDTGQTTDYYVSLLRPQADILVAVSHLGLDGDEVDAESTEGQTANDEDQVHGDVDLVLGGHLHIVLLPPKLVPVLINNQQTGQIILAHSGAFAKTYGRLDLVAHVNTPDEIAADYQQQLAQQIPFAAPRRGSIKAFDYHVEPVVGRQPIDGDMCVTPNEDSSGQACVATANSADDGYCQFATNADGSRKTCSLTSTNSTPCPTAGDTCLACIYCNIPEDGYVANLLEPYVLQLNSDVDLTRVFAVAAVPDEILRTNYGGGDSQLGNLVAASMRTEQDVQADFALTNSLGIRADMSAGPVSVDEMYNIFPFQNSITVLYMSGTEIKEMLDFTSYTSGERGCISQSQISGGGFVMDCTEGVSDLVLIGSGRSCSTSTDCTVSADAIAQGGSNEVCGMDLGFCTDSENNSLGANQPCAFTGIPITFSVPLASLTSGEVFATYTPGVAGTIVSVSAQINAAGSTAGSISVQAGVGASGMLTSTGGGQLTLTDASNSAGTAGNTLSFSEVNQPNAFAASQQIGLTATVTAPFTQGQVTFTINYVPQPQCPDYLALDGTMHPQSCTGSYLPICGKLLNPEGEYRVAVNDYIGNGGSGFLVLAQNTTKVNTGIGLRDALIDYMNDMDNPAYEGPFECTSSDSDSTQFTCHGAIRCDDPRWLTNNYLQSVYAVTPTTAAAYGCEANPNVSACFGHIICVLPNNQQSDGRITPRLE